MSKLYSKIKKWVSGVLAIQLVLGIFIPAVAYGATPVVSVDFLVTSDSTPALTGTVDDPTAIVTVTVNTVPYPAINNFDGTWNIPDNIVGPLVDGVYDVLVVGDNLVDPPGNDTTVNELVIDTIAPVISETTPVTDPTNDNTPAYSFTSNESGTIVYGGDCTSPTIIATVGVNTVVFNTLSEGLHSNCTIDVIDAANNNSNQLPVSSFTIDTVDPVISGVAHGAYYNTDVVPTFNEGTAVLKYSGNIDPFTSGTTVSDEDVYILEVTDAATNQSTAVFTLDKTAPVITLNGANPFPLERGATFTDPGASTDTGEGVVNAGSVNTSVIGDYPITYNATDLAGNAAVEVTRTVQVRDTLYPFVNAGTDKVTNAPIFQDASADDGPFALVSIVWSQDSGPGSAIFSPDPLREDPILSADTDGVYELRLTATDAGSNSSWDLMQLTWDTTAPTVDAGPDVALNSPFTQNATTNDVTSGIASYAWSQEGGPGTITFNTPNAEDTLMSASVDGVYTVRLTVTDNAGNVGWDEFTLTWDTVDPTVTNVSVDVDYDPYIDGYSLKAYADVSDDRSGIDTATCEYTPDNGLGWYTASYDFVNDQCFVNLTSVVDGITLNINFRVNDNASNQGIGTPLTRTSDSADPYVTSLNVNPTFGVYTSRSPQVVGTIADTVSNIVSCEVDFRENAGSWNGWQAGNLVAGTCTANLSSLNNGSTYDFRMRGTDEVGHVGGETTVITRTVDDLNPNVNAGPDRTENSTFTQDATATDIDSGIASYAWTMENGPLGGGIIFGTPNAEDTQITATLDGTYTIRLTVTDNVGNVAWDEFTLVWDTVAPTVGQANVIVDYNPYVDGVSFTAWADVSDDRSGIDTATCEYTPDNGLGWYTASYDFINDQCFVNLSSVVDGAVLTINFRVWDNAVNMGLGSSITRTADTLAPNFSNLTVSPDFAGFTSANPNISVDVTDTVSPVTSCEYQTQENSGGWSAYIPANWNGSECTFGLSNLNDGSVYDINIRAFDSVGHQATIMFSRTVDGMRPTVDAGTDVRTNVQTLLDATATDGASGISSYSWTQVSGPGTLAFVTPGLEDTLVSANLDGNYIARLTVTDNVGNSSSDTVLIDWDTKVNTVKNLVVEAGDSELRLSWDNPSDSDLTEIKILRSKKAGEEGVLIATVYPGTEKFVDTGLTNGTAYYYTLRTVDDLGNTAKTSQVSGTPEEPMVPLTYSPTTSDDESTEDIEGDDESKEIKSGVTDNEDGEDEGEESSTEVPTFGIIVLLLLIMLGVYLLYLQNPELFKRLAFWKKRGGDDSPRVDNQKE